MECQSKSSQKYLLLQVWCGLLTVAMVVMAALFASAKPKSAEGQVSALQQDNVSQTGSRPSYIQLRRQGNLWTHMMKCDSCSLILHNSSIQSKTRSLYFIYAHVNFFEVKQKTQTRSVILKRNASYGKSEMKLVEGILPHAPQGTSPPTHMTYGTLWVGKIVRLSVNESISLDITGDYLRDSTFWGAYQIH